MQEENSRTEIFLLVEDDEIRSRIETVMAWQIKATPHNSRMEMDATKKASLS